jgi:glycosyltransferase
MSTPKIYAYLVCKDNLNDVQVTVNSLGDLVNLSFFGLIVCDSSKDDQIEQYLKSEGLLTHCIYKWTQPEGIYPAMNLLLDGIDEGSFIWYLNPGDLLIDPQIVLKLFSEVKVRNLQWGFGQAKPIASDSQQSFPKQIFSKVYETVYSGKLQISHQSMIVRNDVLLELGKFNTRYRIAADYDLQLKLSKSFKPFFLPVCMVEFNENGLSHQKRLRPYFESFLIRASNGNRSYKKAFLTTFGNFLSRYLKGLVN